MGLRSHQTTRVTGSLNETCIGTDLLQSTHVVASVHQLAQLLHMLSLLVDSDLSAKISPVGLAAVLIVCQRFDLLVRPLLSVFFHCNGFTDAANHATSASNKCTR